MKTRGCQSIRSSSCVPTILAFKCHLNHDGSTILIPMPCGIPASVPNPRGMSSQCRSSASAQPSSSHPITRTTAQPPRPPRERHVPTAASQPGIIQPAARFTGPALAYPRYVLPYLNVCLCLISVFSVLHVLKRHLRRKSHLPNPVMHHPLHSHPPCQTIQRNPYQYHHKTATTLCFRQSSCMRSCTCAGRPDSFYFPLQFFIPTTTSLSMLATSFFTY